MTVAVSKPLSAPEAYFARLVACEGMRPSRAYRIAWKSKTEASHVLAPRVMARPHVAAKIAELRARAEQESLMDLRERRKLLADTARSVPKSEKASHSDRIAAIREDAILAGERRADGSQVSLTLDISVGAIIGALRGGLAEPLPVQAIDLKEVSAAVGNETFPLTQQPSDASDPLPRALPESPPQAVAGPLGLLRTNGHTNGATNGHKPVNGLHSSSNGHGRGFVVEE